MSTETLYRIREMTIFFLQTIRPPQRCEIAHFMGDGNRWNDEECLERLRDIVGANYELLESRGRSGWNQPDKAPLGYFAIFDHWQYYMEQFE